MRSRTLAVRTEIAAEKVARTGIEVVLDVRTEIEGA